MVRHSWIDDVVVRRQLGAVEQLITHAAGLGGDCPRFHDQLLAPESKRLRPVLLLLAARFGPAASESALLAAAAGIELLHEATALENDRACDLSGQPIVRLVAVSKQFGERDRSVWALRDVTLDVHPGEFVSVMGPSGSGKSTLLNLIAGLDVPSSGEVYVDGQRISNLSDGELARMRRRTIAYVFQFFNLLPTLSAAQNVAVPLRADGRPRAEVHTRVEQALKAVGLTTRADHYPNQLSGGEMQRVAIARGLWQPTPA